MWANNLNCFEIKPDEFMKGPELWLNDQGVRRGVMCPWSPGWDRESTFCIVEGLWQYSTLGFLLVICRKEFFSIREYCWLRKRSCFSDFRMFQLGVH